MLPPLKADNDTKVEDLEAEVAKLRDAVKDVDQLRADKQKQESVANESSTLLEDLKAKLVSIESDLSKSIEDKNNAHSQLKSLEQRSGDELSAKEEEAALNKQALSALQEDLVRHQQGAADLEETSTKLNEQIASLKQSNAESEKSKAEEIARLNAATEELQAKVDTHEKAAKDAEESGNGHAAKASELQAVVEKLQDEIKTMAQSKSDVGDEIKELQSTVASLQASLERAESQLQDAPTQDSVATLHEQLSQAQESQKKLEADHQAAMEKTRADLADDHEKSLDEHTKKLEDVQQKLDAAVAEKEENAKTHKSASDSLRAEMEATHSTALIGVQEQGDREVRELKDLLASRQTIIDGLEEDNKGLTSENDSRQKEIESMKGEASASSQAAVEKVQSQYDELLEVKLCPLQNLSHWTDS